MLKDRKKFRKSKNIIGWNIKAAFLAFARGNMLNDAMCMWIKGKNLGLVGSTIQMRRYVEKENYFFNVPLHIGHIHKLKTCGFFYKKRVKCSRLVKARFLW